MVELCIIFILLITLGLPVALAIRAFFKGMESCVDALDEVVAVQDAFCERVLKEAHDKGLL